jgi:iron(III) transport system substrate-binding protein
LAEGDEENALVYKGNGVAMKAVNAGEVDGAVIYHYCFFGDQAETDENSNSVELYYFRNEDPGAFVSTSGGAVLASSKHAAEAQAFIKWITGKAGRRS